MKHVILKLSIAYLVAMALCIAVLTSLPSWRQARDLEHVCYGTNAMIPVVECKGFPTVIEWVLNFPLLAVYLPIAGLDSIRNFQAQGLLFLAGGLLIWFPVFYLVSKIYRRVRP